MREPDLIDIESASSNAECLHFDWQDAKELREVDEVEMGGCWGVDCGLGGAASSISLESPPVKSMPLSLGSAILLPVANDWLATAPKDCCDVRNA